MQPDPDSSMPPDPVSPAAAAYLATFVMFRGFVDAGFSEDQALRIVAYWLHAAGEAPAGG